MWHQIQQIMQIEDFKEYYYHISNCPLVTQSIKLHFNISTNIIHYRPIEQIPIKNDHEPLMAQTNTPIQTNSKNHTSKILKDILTIPKVQDSLLDTPPVHISF
jgi:hypothetical protein